VLTLLMIQPNQTIERCISANRSKWQQILTDRLQYSVLNA